LLEQISFLLKGGCTTQLPSNYLSNLDSDLPFYLWWQGELLDPMDAATLGVGRPDSCYDSHDWKNFPAQMALVETGPTRSEAALVLCDLNWTRLTTFAVSRSAQFFDHPASHHRLAKVARYKIDLCAGV